MKELKIKPSLEHFEILFVSLIKRSSPDNGHLMNLLKDLFETQSPSTLAKFTRLPHPTEVSSLIAAVLAYTAIASLPLVKSVLRVR